MPGGILQLISSNGMNTLYLLGDPHITYFKVVYRRPTNFSIFDYVQYHASAIEAGGGIDFDIQARGDLLCNTTLQIELPEIKFKPILISEENLQNSLNKYGIPWKKSNNPQYMDLMNDLKKHPELKRIAAICNSTNWLGETFMHIHKQHSKS